MDGEAEFISKTKKSKRRRHAIAVNNLNLQQ